MHKKLIAGEEAGTYTVDGVVTKDDLIDIAKKLSKESLRKGKPLTSPAKMADYLQVILHDVPHEVFGIVFLDTKHRVIRFEEMFRGTLDAAAVYPREIAKTALKNNTAAVVVVHNHPSGDPTPSEVDNNLTKKIQEVLELLDIRLLDHIIVGYEGYTSYAEKGLI